MARGIRIRTSTKDDLTTVQAIITHPMDTGNSRDPETGDMIPAFFIETVTIHHGEKVIMSCDWSRAVSKNPYLSFTFKGAKAEIPSASVGKTAVAALNQKKP